jgi:hypothetical protein
MNSSNPYARLPKQNMRDNFRAAYFLTVLRMKKKKPDESADNDDAIVGDNVAADEDEPTFNVEDNIVLLLEKKFPDGNSDAKM